MTRPTAGMVTDDEAAKWGDLFGLRVLEHGSYGWASKAIKRLLADRERTLGLLAGLLPAVECAWEQDGTCTPENCMKEEARKALKEAGREA